MSASLRSKLAYLELSPKQRLLAATLICCVIIGFYFTYNMKASWDFTLLFRAKKLATFIIVACCISTATLLFQTLSNNRILTPAIMGFDAMYVLIQSILIFYLGTIQYSQLNLYFKWGLEISILVLVASAFFQWVFVKKQCDLYLLILIGVVCGVLLQSLSALIMRITNPTQFTLLQDSMFANFNAVSTPLLVISSVLVCTVLVYVWRHHYQFDVLALGRPLANNLGINHAKFSRQLIVVITILIGLSTSLVGPVTFFGLLVVNLAYLCSGSTAHRYLIPMSILIAMITLVGGDVVLQHGLNYSSRLSVIIEFIGGLLFIILLLRNSFK